jgi:hypothetical protein
MDHQTGAYLDLSDPFAGRAMWQSWARDRASPPVPPAAPEAGDLRVISRLIGLLRTGRSAQSRSDWQGD